MKIYNIGGKNPINKIKKKHEKVNKFIEDKREIIDYWKFRILLGFIFCLLSGFFVFSTTFAFKFVLWIF